MESSCRIQSDTSSPSSFAPNRPGQQSCSWTIQMKPQNLKKSLCGEMKKSPKFLDFCIIFEIHVLASILHYQVLQIKIVFLHYSCFLFNYLHTALSHKYFSFLYNMQFNTWLTTLVHVLSWHTSDSNRADTLFIGHLPTGLLGFRMLTRRSTCQPCNNFCL